MWPEQYTKQYSAYFNVYKYIESQAYLNNMIHLVQQTNGSNNVSYSQEVSPDVSKNIFLDSVNPTNSSAYITASMFRNVSVPFICLFGGLGNTMSMVTLLYRKLRYTSCNVYLALRSLSDTLFLLTLLAVWFDSVGVPFFHTKGICQIVVFTSYVTSFLSVWSVAAITFENYIRVCHPTKVNIFCTYKKAIRAVISMVILAIVVYQSSLWSTDIVDSGHGFSMCMTKSEFKYMYLVLTYIDTAFTLFVPLFFILFFSVCIVYSVTKSFKRRVRFRRAVLVHTGNFNFWSTPQAGVTRLLFAVSITFVILHTPIHIIKLIMVVKIYILKRIAVDPIDAVLKTIFENMYYLNFCANFLVFFICGSSFRRIFWQLFCKCRRHKEIVFRNVEQQTELTLLESTRRFGCTQTRGTLKESDSQNRSLV